ncbi:collagen alpha-1(XII) chain-like isoform X2 [Clavelina lepadiformis]|uniref:collagen alpha-1(XII) chain-like isoform X2 n=1 Tax=Clavelina lepadiformis TaxID=159417 RepID=UPI0040416854
MNTVLLMLSLIATAQGLRCMTCENARSHEDCDSQGVMRECLENELSCAIEERKVNYGPGRLIFKHCKQPLACNNNYIQNDRPAWWPIQCNDKFPNSVCRCCCFEDECNIGHERCFGKAAAISCGNQEVVRGGITTCSDGNRFRSKCDFQCQAPAQIYPPDSSSSVCLEDGSWSKPAPCCANPCPSLVVVDLVIILDSSSSVGEAGWQTLLSFTRSLLSLYTLGNNSVEVAVVRYNAEVDTDNIIPLDNGFNRDELFAAISSLPYDGSGTRTGNAINFTREFILENGHGHREFAHDLVVVLTDGRSQDDVAVPSRLLRERGVMTYAIGIRPDQAPDNFDIRNDLLNIAGSEDHFFVVEDGFSRLNADFAEEITREICSDPCGLTPHL